MLISQSVPETTFYTSVRVENDDNDTNGILKKAKCAHWKSCNCTMVSLDGYDSKHPRRYYLVRGEQRI